MKVRSFGNNPARGSSTLEILIAFAILTLTLTAVIMVVFSNQSVSVDTQTEGEALDRARAILETERALGRQSFSSVVTTATTTDSIYQKSAYVEQIDSSDKQVTSFVSWVDGGRQLLVKLSTTLTDWTHPASKCSATLSGDWTAPQDYKGGYGYVDIVSNTGATGVDVHGTKAYLTSDPSSAGTDDFYIIDVSNPKPSGLNLPILSHFSTSYGLADVKVAGTNAYVAADSAAYQLLIIDVSDSTSLDTTKIEAKLDVTTSGDSAVGNTLAYDNKTIYLGLTKSSLNGPDFYIIDVSNPLHPAVKGSYTVGAEVNQILISGTRAYLATASTTPVITLDISNPYAPTLIAKSKSMSSVITGQSLLLTSGTQIYVGMIGGNANPKLYALATTSISGTPDWTLSMNKKSGVYRMVLRGNLLFMTTSDPNDGFQIWDVSNPASAPTRYDTSPLNIQQTSTAGMDCSGNYLFVGQRSNRALQIVGPS